MPKITMLRSHVTGNKAGVPINLYISHDARLIEHAYCAAFFALTGEVFSEVPREYNVAKSDEGFIIFRFRLQNEKEWTFVKIQPFGRDD